MNEELNAKIQEQMMELLFAKPPSPEERRRYALLQAAATLLACGKYDFNFAVAEARDLIDEIERKESK